MENKKKKDSSREESQHHKKNHSRRKGYFIDPAAKENEKAKPTNPKSCLFIFQRTIPITSIIRCSQILVKYFPSVIVEAIVLSKIGSFIVFVVVVKKFDSVTVSFCSSYSVFAPLNSK